MLSPAQCHYFDSMVDTGYWILDIEMILIVVKLAPEVTLYPEI